MLHVEGLGKLDSRHLNMCPASLANLSHYLPQKNSDPDCQSGALRGLITG